MVALPIGSAAGQAISGHGSAHIFFSSAAPVQGWGESGTAYNPLSIAVSNVNNSTTAIIGNDQSMVVGNNTTFQFYSTAYLLSNVTLNQLNSHSANRIEINVKSASAGNLTIGYGYAKGNSSYHFSPLESAAFTGNATNFTGVTFAMDPALLSENGTLMFQVQFTNASAVSTYTISAYAVGTSSAQPWYAVGESGGYLVGGSMLFIAGFLALPHLDINVSKYTEPVKKKVSGTSRKSTRKGGRK